MRAACSAMAGAGQHINVSYKVLLENTAAIIQTPACF